MPHLSASDKQNVISGFHKCMISNNSQKNESILKSFSLNIWCKGKYVDNWKWYLTILYELKIKEKPVKVFINLCVLINTQSDYTEEELFVRSLCAVWSLVFLHKTQTQQYTVGNKISEDHTNFHLRKVCV